MSPVNFDYRCGILEAADPVADREWSWFKGDAWITETQQRRPPSWPIEPDFIKRLPFFGVPLFLRAWRPESER